MEDFLIFVNKLRVRFPVHVEIYYSKIMDWCIKVYKKGCAEMYPESKHSEEDAIIVDVQDNDMELAFAKAHVAIKEWLMSNNGGY